MRSLYPGGQWRCATKLGRPKWVPMRTLAHLGTLSMEKVASCWARLAVSRCGGLPSGPVTVRVSGQENSVLRFAGIAVGGSNAIGRAMVIGVER